MGDMDDIAHGNMNLLHVNIWFGIQLVNSLLQSFISMSGLTNSTSVLPKLSLLKTWRIISADRF
jgi:hypothetical protein